MSAQILKFTQPVKNSPHYFGGCPYCGDNAGYMNVGSNHWCVCDTHKTKWQIGSNLFSGWKNETEEEWKRNAYKLQNYMTVEPLPWDGVS